MSVREALALIKRRLPALSFLLGPSRHVLSGWDGPRRIGP